MPLNAAAEATHLSVAPMIDGGGLFVVQWFATRRVHRIFMFRSNYLALRLRNFGVLA